MTKPLLPEEILHLRDRIIATDSDLERRLALGLLLMELNRLTTQHGMRLVSPQEEK